MSNRNATTLKKKNSRACTSISSIEINEVISNLGIISKNLQEKKIKPWDAFVERDKDRSQDLSVLEFSEWIASLRENNQRKLLSLNQAEKLVYFLDVNKDGKVDFREFVTAIQLYRYHKKRGTLHLWEGAYTHSPIHAEAECIFPDWLKQDSNFRTIFTRYNTADYRDMREQEKKLLDESMTTLSIKEKEEESWEPTPQDGNLSSIFSDPKRSPVKETDPKDDVVMLELSLAKVNHMRTSKDRRRIAKWLKATLLNRLIMEEEFNLDQLSQLCHNVEIEKKAESQNILNGNEDSSSCCYILLKGSVNLTTHKDTEKQSEFRLYPEDFFGGHLVLRLLEQSRETNLEQVRQRAGKASDGVISASAGKGGASLVLLQFETVHRWLQKLREEQRHVAIRTLHKSVTELSVSKHRYLASQCVFRNYSPGSTIFDEGALADNLYFIIKGTVFLSRSVKLSDGNMWPVGLDAVESVTHHRSLHFRLATIREGGWFGEEFLIGKTRRIYSATVGNEEVQAFTICAPIIKRICRKENPFHRVELEKLYRPIEEIIHEYRTRRQAEKNYEDLKLSALGDSYLRRKVGNAPQSNSDHISTTNGKRPWSMEISPITKDWTAALRDNTNLLGSSVPSSARLRGRLYHSRQRTADKKDTSSVQSARSMMTPTLPGGRRPMLKKINSWSDDSPATTTGFCIFNTRGEEIKFPSCLPALMCQNPADRKFSHQKVKGTDLLSVAESSNILGVLQSEGHTESTIFHTQHSNDTAVRQPNQERKGIGDLGKGQIQKPKCMHSDLGPQFQPDSSRGSRKVIGRKPLMKMKRWQSNLNVKMPPH